MAFDLEKYRQEEDEIRERNRNKMGEYTGDDCPNCGRQRIMICEDDKKRRCEKCYWCIEDKAYDLEFLEYMR